jgi:hypothetical protein
MEDKHRKKLARIAFQLFSIWTKNAVCYYPDVDFTIADETELINDLERAVLDGIKSLRDEEKEIDRGVPGYDYGFLIGFIQGSLSFGWTHEYILKNSDSYRNSMACKAILEYLKFDTKIGARMSRLYKSLLEKDTNLAKVRTDIDKIEVGKYQIDEIDETIQYPEKHSPIYQYLENQLSRHVVAVLDDNNGQEFMPDLDLYFEPGFVRELLLTYEK